jgi:hypothetical protein
MKREIKFKAQRLDGKGWVVGQLAYFFDSEKTPYIMPNCYFGTRELGEYDDDDNPILSDEIALGGFIAVNPETVCQFTGKLDINKNNIFENDIVQYSENPLNKVIVVWNKRTCGFVLNTPNYKNEFTRISGLGKLKVIGNTHD